MWNYSEKMMDHFLNPRNVGDIKDAEAVAEVGNITCGDALKLFLKIDKNTDKIVDAKFQTFGCGSAIASSSALTEMVKGLSLDEALAISNKHIADFLDGLPEEKMHCSVMGKEALEKAIVTYRGGTYQEAEHDPEGEIVCVCFGVTDKLIEKVIRENDLTTVEEITHYCKAGGGCGGCIPQIEEILKKVRAEITKEREAKKSDRKLTNLQKIQMVQETIEKEVRPSLQKDGGDIDLIDIDGNNVIVELRGHCAGCMASPFTLKGLVEAKLKEFVSDDLYVTVNKEI